MESRTYAFETRTGAAARSDRKCTEKYIEDAPQPVSRFWAKSLLAGRALPGMMKGGA